MMRCRSAAILVFLKFMTMSSASKGRNNFSAQRPLYNHQVETSDYNKDFISKQKPVTTGNQYPNQYPEYWPLHNVEDDELFSEILDEHIVEHIIPNTFSRNTDSFTDLYSPYHNPILPKSNLNAPEAFKPAVEKVHNFQQREQTLFRDDASRSAINTGVADYIDAIVQY